MPSPVRFLVPLLLWLCVLVGCADPAPRPIADPVIPRAGLFLVAARGIVDPRFREAVILLVEHSEKGSLGLTVNLPSDLFLGQRMADTGKLRNEGYRLYFGGPVDAGVVMFLVRAAKTPERSTAVLGDLYFGTSRTTLESLLEADTPQGRMRVFLGHASWDPGQLAGELKAGAWHLVEAHVEQVFTPRPRELWHELIQRVAPEGVMARADTRLEVFPVAMRSRRDASCAGRCNDTRTDPGGVILAGCRDPAPWMVNFSPLPHGSLISKQGCKGFCRRE
jgi:putative transcriptional regulator